MIGLRRNALFLVLLCGSAGCWGDDGETPGQSDDQGSGNIDPAVDTGRWLCSLCPYPLGWFGTAAFGPGYVSDSSLKFGNYRGLEEKGLFLSLDGDAHYRDGEGRYFDLYARNLGIESRQLEIRGGRQGRYELRLGYQEIPRFRGHGTATPFLDAGTPTMSLPATWVHARTTGGMTALDDSARATALKTKRKTLDAGLSLRGQSRWSFEADFEHQRKSGSRPFGAGVFTIDAAHFPAPVDFTTNRFDLGLNFAGDRSHLRFGFAGSAFDNGSSAVLWENPFIAIPGTENPGASLEPDNDYYQFNFSGAWSPTPRIRLSGRAAAGRMSQDDPFLPYTTNPTFSDLPLPRSSLDGRVDTATLNLAGRFAARLSRGLDLTATVKVDDRDNKTPVDSYTPVITDLVLRPPRLNRPYSFRREKFDLYLRYRAPGAVRLQAGLRREDMERSLQAVEETQEDTAWGEIAFNRWAAAQLRFRLEASDRDASPYRALEDGGPVEHPLMRKFNLADRDRDRLLAELDLAPSGGVSVSLSWYATEDDYEASVIGLQESEERSLSLDIGWSPNRRVTVYGFASRQDFDSSMAGAADLGTDFWQSDSEDRFVTVGAGFQARLGHKIELGFDYLYSDSEGIVATDSGRGEAPFPVLETELSNARLHISYQAGERWGWKLLAEHERYDSSDWYVDGLGPDGIPNILTMGLLSPGYDVTVLRVLANYRY